MMCNFMKNCTFLCIIPTCIFVAVDSGISEVLLAGVFTVEVVSAGGSFGTVVYS